jgi:hypothetical protein
VLALLAVVLLYVATLVFPSPLFEHKARFGEYRVYSDQPIAADFRAVIDETARRVEAMEQGPAAGSVRVYLCRSLRLYGFFAFLTRMNPESLAISLSANRSMFVSLTRVEEFAARNRDLLRHTRFEGNLAEVLAHELAHFGSIRTLGYRRHLALPVWKSEGWAEYQANLAAIRRDPDYDLRQRIDRLLDERLWPPAPSLARSLWEWQLLVEYLGEVEGLGLAELADAELTMPAVRERMLRWHGRERQVSPSRDSSSSIR